MSRMDKYEEVKKDERVFSRTQRNQDMYKDVYLNNTFVDYGDVKINEEEIEEKVEEPVPVEYIEKNYDVNEYIRKAHENRVNDNVKRSLDNTDCEVTRVNEKEDEISKLIKSIEEREQEFDTEFFGDLLPDDGDTVVTDPVDETKLEKVIEKEELENYHEEKIDEGRDDFMDVLDKKRSGNIKLPMIVFCITAFLLVAVIVLIFVVL